MSDSGIFQTERGQSVAARDSTPLLPTRDPVRGTSRRSFRAKCHSLKNARFIKCESLLELQVTWMFELLSGIESYTEQPPPLRLKVEPATPTRRYTPDFCLKWRGAARWLVEVKPQELADSDDWRKKFQAAAIAAIAKGDHFVVLTERHLKAAGIGEIQRVLEQRHRRYVENLGEPQALTGLDGDLGDAERRVLKVLADAFDSSPSIRVLKTLGVPDVHNPFEHYISFTTTGVRDEYERSLVARPRFFVIKGGRS